MYIFFYFISVNLWPLQKALNYNDNEFKMIVSKDRHGNHVRAVKWSMDLGALYKMGNKGRATKHQQEMQTFPAKTRRGSAPTGAKAQHEFQQDGTPEWSWLIQTQCWNPKYMH